MSVTARLCTGISVALALWFLMFSPVTSGLCSFWLEMSLAAVILTCISIWGTAPVRKAGKCARYSFRACFKKAIVQTAEGVAIALALWGIFWIGDKLSGLIFDFARGQVDSVYMMKEGTSPALIASLLLFLIGPAEEFFWRGYVQATLGRLTNPDLAFVITTAIYALAHIWSGNFMLVMAALVAGGVWGLIYRVKPALLPALIISHAVWDALVFVVFPI